MYQEDTLDNSGEYSFDPQWSPRIAYTFKADPNHTIFASISHGFSPPTLEETLTPEGQLNPEILPETGWNYEIGTRGKILDNRLFYDFSIYTMRIDNLLVARRVQDDIFIGVNAGKTVHNGIDLTLDYNLIRTIHPVWSSANLFLNYMFADYSFKEFEDGDEDYSGNELTGTPQNKLNAGLNLAINLGFYGDVEYMYVDEMPMNDSNSAYSESYSLLNLKLGYRKAFGANESLQLDIMGGINNSTDTKYASMISVNAPSFGGNPPRYYYPGLPRNYYGGIRLIYNFK